MPELKARVPQLPSERNTISCSVWHACVVHTNAHALQRCTAREEGRCDVCKCRNRSPARNAIRFVILSLSLICKNNCNSAGVILIVNSHIVCIHYSNADWLASVQCRLHKLHLRRPQRPHLQLPLSASEWLALAKRHWCNG